MALVNMRKLLRQAQEEHRAVGAFNVGNMEMAMGAVRAAEETHTPIILQIAEKRMKHSPLALMAPIMLESAYAAEVDVAVHLDHAVSLKTVRTALEYGFTSIMFDGSQYALKENVRLTKEAAAIAIEYDASIEAELGVVGGSEGGAEQEIRFTNPDDAKRFSQETGIDCLAVAIGNAHGDYPTVPHLAFDVLQEIHERCAPLPLVLHGGSGICDRDFRKAISLGIVKINIGTATFHRLTRRAEEYLRTEGKHNYFHLNEAMMQGAYESVRHHIEVFNCKSPLNQIRPL